jgi:hypothetical protein
MNDIDVQDGLRDYYKSITPGTSVRVSMLVGAAIVARRQRGASRTWARLRVLVGVAAAVTVALGAGIGFAAWRTGLNGGLPGGPAGSPSPKAVASASPIEAATGSPITSATETATPRPSPTLRAATSSTPAGEFSPTGSMNGRYDAATLLLDGRVLMTGDSTLTTIGDYQVRIYSSAAELYDPATGTFTPTGSMVQAQGGATITRLADGRVLFAGGTQASDSGGKIVLTRLATAELYDPATGKFSATGSLTRPRADHTATLLDSGEVLVAGGDGDSSAEDNTAELYDPATGSFKRTGDMTMGRAMAKAIALTDGRVLVLGYFSGTTVTKSAELYDPKSGTFSPTGSMTTARMSPSVTLLRDGRVLIASGQMDSSASSAELFDPTTGTFSPTGSFIHERAVTVATLLLDGRVLFEGGTYSPFGAHLQPEHAAANAMTAQLAGGPAVIGLQYADFRVAPAPTTGCGMPGATAPSITYASAELYDPTTGKFVMTGSMRTPRAANTATLLLDGRVLITGGDTTGLTAELYQP